MKTYSHFILVVVPLFTIFSFQLSTAFAQSTAFTYQGRLQDNGVPANGSYDFQFTIYDSTNGAGPAVAGPITNSAIAVSNGLFTLTLDFGSGVFSGPDRWLDVGVRTNGDRGAFTILSPRRLMAPAPHAIFANTASNVIGEVNASKLGGLPASNYQTTLGFMPLTPQQATNVAITAAQSATNDYLLTSTNVAIAQASAVVSTNNHNRPAGGTFSQYDTLSVTNVQPIGNNDLYIFIPQNQNLYFVPAGFTNFDGGITSRTPHIQSDGGFYDGAYITLNGSTNYEGFLTGVGMTSADLGIEQDTTHGIVVVEQDPSLNVFEAWAGLPLYGGMTNSWSLPAQKANGPNVRIQAGGRMSLFHGGLHQFYGNWLLFGVNQYGDTGGPWYTNYYGIWQMNNYMSLAVETTNGVPTESILAASVTTGLPASQLTSVSLYTNLVVLTNGSLVFNGPVILNPGPAPVVTGNQIGWWNSNGVSYQVTATSTNLW